MRLRRAGPAQSEKSVSDPASLRRTRSHARPWRQAGVSRSAAILVGGHKPMDVRHRVGSEKHLLAASISGFDREPVDVKPSADAWRSGRQTSALRRDFRTPIKLTTRLLCLAERRSEVIPSQLAVNALSKRWRDLDDPTFAFIGIDLHPVALERRGACGNQAFPKRHCEMRSLRRAEGFARMGDTRNL